MGNQFLSEGVAGSEMYWDIVLGDSENNICMIKL